ncbi:MAG: hypothetical protein KAG10_10290, partial [Methylococcales bacterium]|nr:hypothetical protein [Methylococcales bacterium]
MITGELNSNEHDELSNALNKYFNENRSNHTVKSKHRDFLIEKLKKKLLPIYCKSPEIKDLYERFDFTAENISYALEPRYVGHKKLCPRFKSRFLIWALEYEGYFDRPKYMSNDDLYYSFVNYIYKEKEKEYLIKNNGNLQGIYLVKRLSFNNSLPDRVAVSRMWIWFDEKKKILRYQTINKYEQIINGETLDRERITKGYIFKFQGNILLLGDVAYLHTHQKTADNTFHHYPEILLVHTHDGDAKNIRGLMLGNYPILNLPVATSVLISKELSPNSSDESVENNLNSYMKESKYKTDSLIGLKKLSDIGELKN